MPAAPLTTTKSRWAVPRARPPLASVTVVVYAGVLGSVPWAVSVSASATVRSPLSVWAAPAMVTVICTPSAATSMYWPAGSTSAWVAPPTVNT